MKLPSRISLLWWSLLSLGILCLCLGRAERAQAADLPPDYACRECHESTDRQITLPSGETAPVLVDMAVLDASPHNRTGASPVYCSSCHKDQVRYRYPHAENPAQSLQEFRAEVAGNCQSCHYPHMPFHDAEALGDKAPVCVDCHGAHDIAPVDQIGTAMPANCVACHTDQTPEWAQQYVAPRPGMGEGAAGYAGSARCNGCHDDTYVTWQATLHANLIHNADADPEAVLGDFSLSDPDLTFTQADVVYTIGNRWKQDYLTQTVEGKLALLPAQWDVATATWEPLSGDGEPGQEWLPACGSCHVTGLDTQTWGFTEFNIGCESCHGPGAAHAADPENVKPYTQVDDQVCGACHSRGVSADGHPFPATYRPGETLTDHFTFTQDAAHVWPDGSARANHQQFMDWQLGSSMVTEGKLNCVTCHEVHVAGEVVGQLVAPLNDLCLSCHNEQKALARHTPFHEQAMNVQHNEFLCTDCHMPLMATSATAFDLHNHSFLQPNPQGSVDHGGLDVMPNACNRCHSGSGEDAAWAAQTVAHVKEVATPSPSEFFGPGPTPTSPPPPTPIAATARKVVPMVVRPGWVLRVAAYAAGVLIVLVVLAIAGYIIRSRRIRHV